MFGQFLFESPLRFIPDLTSGSIIRYGAILKDAGTGRIVGHLQESGVAQSLLSQVLSSGPSPLSLVSSLANTGTGVYTAIQVRQLKAMMDVLQALQAATLGVSLVGVGVSVAGFLYMHKRFNRLDSRLDELIDAVKAGFENLDRSTFRQHVSRTKSLMKRTELAKTLTDPSKEYRELAAQLADQAAFFEGEIDVHVSAKGPINHEKFWLLAQFLMLCNNARIDCQIRANEMLHAQHVSERIAGEYQALFERLGPASFDVDLSQGRATVKVLRDATDSAHSRPYLLDHLRIRRIDGPVYIDGIEREKEHPMLVVPTS